MILLPVSSLSYGENSTLDGAHGQTEEGNT
jgi:hypothetical protein